MSALRLGADIYAGLQHVCFVPTTEVASLHSTDLVGERQHRRWNFETDRFRSLAVEDEQIARRLFERQIRGSVQFRRGGWRAAAGIGACGIS
jgi:hypothetical protein